MSVSFLSILHASFMKAIDRDPLSYFRYLYTPTVRYPLPPPRINCIFILTWLPKSSFIFFSQEIFIKFVICTFARDENRVILHKNITEYKFKNCLRGLTVSLAVKLVSFCDSEWIKKVFVGCKMEFFFMKKITEKL